MKFEELNLIKPLLKAISEEGYLEPTPIQVKAIPHLLDGSDLMGCAQTGTGMTAAFALPIIQKLTNEKPKATRRPVRALILAPTRELATQIYKSFMALGRHTPVRGVVIYGGVGQKPQADALKDGVDFVVATPGRLLDLMNQGLARLDTVEVLVLDEADRMLDMGFIIDIRRIIRAIPSKRQTLLFSATLPREIVRLAGNILRSPVSIEVSPEMPTVELTDQQIYMVEQADKTDLLIHLLEDPDFFRVLVFCETKFSADILEYKLNEAAKLKTSRHSGNRKHKRAEAIHSDKSQKDRERVLERFKKGEIQVLVATDIAARGIDIIDVDHVINYDFPTEPQDYIHRIGRTGRAGATGIAISFVTWRDRMMLKKVEELIKLKIEIVKGHPYESTLTPSTTTAKKSPGSGRRRRRR